MGEYVDFDHQKLALDTLVNASLDMLPLIELPDSFCADKNSKSECLSEFFVMNAPAGDGLTDAMQGAYVTDFKTRDLDAHVTNEAFTLLANRLSNVASQNNMDLIRLIAEGLLHIAFGSKEFPSFDTATNTTTVPFAQRFLTE